MADNSYLCLDEFIEPTPYSIPKCSKNPVRIDSNHPEHSASEITLKRFNKALKLFDRKLGNADILEIHYDKPRFNMSRDHEILNDPIKEIARDIIQLL